MRVMEDKKQFGGKKFRGRQPQNAKTDNLARAFSTG